MKIEQILSGIFQISGDAPELNMSNYSEDEVERLNDAMIEIYNLAKQAYDTRTESEPSINYDGVLGTDLIDSKLLIAAIDKWGRDAQVEMIKEECLELALAIQKFARVRGDKVEKYNNIIDEIADVKIMIQQAERLFPVDKINERVKFKMNRLEERLREGIC